MSRAPPEMREVQSTRSRARVELRAESDSVSFIPPASLIRLYIVDSTGRGECTYTPRAPPAQRLCLFMFTVV